MHVDNSQITPLLENTTAGVVADASKVDPAILALQVAINTNDDEFTAFKTALELPIPDQSIVTRHLRNLAVTNPKLAPLAVTADKIADGTISTAKLADMVVTAQKISNGTITEPKYASGSVSTRAMANGSVTASKIDPSIFIPPDASIVFSFDKRSVDVTDTRFGAKGDGITDDTSSIQSAINFLSNNGGGTLLVPNGNYVVTQITLPGKIHVQGNRSTTILSEGTLDTIVCISTQYSKNKISDLQLIRSTKIGSAIKIKRNTVEWGSSCDVDNVTVTGYECGIDMLQAYNCTVRDFRTLQGNHIGYRLRVTDSNTYPSFQTFSNLNTFINCSTKGDIGCVLNGARNNTFIDCTFELHTIAIQVYRNIEVSPIIVNSENVFDQPWFEGISTYVLCNYNLDSSGNVITNTKEMLNRAVMIYEPFGVYELLPANHVPVENTNYDLYKFGYGQQNTNPVKMNIQSSETLLSLFARSTEVPLFQATANNPSVDSVLKQIFQVGTKGLYAPLNFNSMVASHKNTGIVNATPNTVNLSINYSQEIVTRSTGSATAQVNKIATMGILIIRAYLYDGNYGTYYYMLSDSIYGSFVNMQARLLSSENPGGTVTTMTVTPVRLSSPLSNKRIDFTCTGAGIIALRAEIVYLPLGPMTEV